MLAMIDASRAEDGCLAYSYAQDVLEPGLIRVMEMWRVQAALDAHFHSDHITAGRAEWPALGLGERDLRKYEVGEPEPT